MIPGWQEHLNAEPVIGFTGNIGDQLPSCALSVYRRVCGGHVPTDWFKMKVTSSVCDRLKHTQNPAGSPQIVFSSVCPRGTGALRLMKTVCGWTGSHRKTGLLHLLVAPAAFYLSRERAQCHGNMHWFLRRQKKFLSSVWQMWRCVWLILNSVCISHFREPSDQAKHWSLSADNEGCGDMLLSRFNTIRILGLLIQYVFVILQVFNIRIYSNFLCSALVSFQ